MNGFKAQGLITTASLITVNEATAADEMASPFP
jgi:hypothetical protein